MATTPRTINVDLRHLDWAARLLTSAYRDTCLALADEVTVTYRPWLPLGKRLTRTAS